MRRTNTFEIVPQSEQAGTILRRLLDASASLWNQLTYERRRQFFAGESVWDHADYYDEYVDVLGSATTKHIIRVNAAWRSFFEMVEEAEEVSPPGYWGNQADGCDLRTYIRNDAYTISWGKRSRLEVPVSSRLKDEYSFGRAERLRVAVRGEPHWQGDQGRLHLTYDDVGETYRAHQPVTVFESKQAMPTETDAAALDNFGADVDHRDRDSRLDRPEASEFGVDDRPEVEDSDKGDQASLFADTAEDQLTLARDGAADRCLFEE